MKIITTVLVENKGVEPLTLPTRAGMLRPTGLIKKPVFYLYEDHNNGLGGE